jgi:hypothetical protein
LKIVAKGFPTVVGRGMYYLNKEHYRSGSIKDSETEPGDKRRFNNKLKAKCGRIMRK